MGRLFDGIQHARLSDVFLPEDVPAFAAFVAAPPVPLFHLPADIVLEGMYSDGERFIARRRLPAQFKGDRIEAIVNWLDQVKAKVPSEN